MSSGFLLFIKFEHLNQGPVETRTWQAKLLPGELLPVRPYIDSLSLNLYPQS